MDVLNWQPPKHSGTLVLWSTVGMIGLTELFVAETGTSITEGDLRRGRQTISCKLAVSRYQPRRKRLLQAAADFAHAATVHPILNLESTMIKHALFVRLEAKPGKEKELAQFLQAGLGQEVTTRRPGRG
jgi:hypothetical protein